MRSSRATRFFCLTFLLTVALATAGEAQNPHPDDVVLNPHGTEVAYQKLALHQHNNSDAVIWIPWDGGAGGRLHFKSQAAGPAGDRVTITTQGKIGIGTTQPGARLHLKYSGIQGGGEEGLLVEQASTGGAGITFKRGSSDYQMFLASEGKLKLGRSGKFDAMTMDGSGRVGIGTTSPGAMLDVAGSLRLGRAAFQNGSTTASPIVTNEDGVNTDLRPARDDSGKVRVMDVNSPGGLTFYNAGASWLNSYSNASNGTASHIYMQTDGGSVRIGADPAGPVGPASTLDVRGTTTTRVLTITGGADLAEPFPITDTEAIAAGSVVVIDEDHPGQLKLSSSPYDMRVAGVLSGANGVKPGITLNAGDVFEDGQNVALTGRVYTRVNTSNGPVRPGDLLTTSEIPGQAMKATDYARAQGAILGKAMSPLSDREGLVLVLVTLQ